jgi:hypothetical protein
MTQTTSALSKPPGAFAAEEWEPQLDGAVSRYLHGSSWSTKGLTVTTRRSRFSATKSMASSRCGAAFWTQTRGPR